jgi:hypothetical protein
VMDDRVCGIEEPKRDLAKLSAAVAPLGGRISRERFRGMSAAPRRSKFVSCL